MPKEFLWKPMTSSPLSKRSIHLITKTFNISKTSAEILLRRGVSSTQDVKKYLYGKYEDLHNPFLFKDMMKAVARVLKAVDKKERVMIHGDYDVDGITSTALITMMFENLGHSNIRPFCPPRSL
jgi:single-stranded-DNA-specific exonuclease